MLIMMSLFLKYQEEKRTEHLKKLFRKFSAKNRKTSGPHRMVIGNVSCVIYQYIFVFVYVYIHVC